MVASLGTWRRYVVTFTISLPITIPEKNVPITLDISDFYITVTDKATGNLPGRDNEGCGGWR